MDRESALSVLRHLLRVILVGCACLALTPGARGECALWENLKSARETADSTAKALHQITIPQDLEANITFYMAQALIEDPGLSPARLLEIAKSKLTLAEQAQCAAWFAARAARDVADDAFKKADKAYTQAVNQKDAALKAAEKEFEDEQAWLTKEKEALKDLPRDNTYLDRVSRITERLKAAYAKLNAAVGPFTECFSDARKFVDDKNERLKRIAALDAEIARRRGLKPGDDPTKPSDKTDATITANSDQQLQADPEAPGPLGDTYIAVGPEISPKQGKITSVSEKGFTFELVDDKGQKRSAKVDIITPPPTRVRANQLVTLQMKASGEAPAYSYANWELNNVIARQAPSDNGCSNIPNFKSVPDSSNAIVRFYFGVGINPYIRVYGGQYNSPDGTDISIVWRYKKEGE